MYLNVVQKDYAQSHTRQTRLLIWVTVTFLLAILTSFPFSLGMPGLRARLRCYGIPWGLFPFLIVCCWCFAFFFFFVVVMGWADAVQPVTSPAGTALACTDIGAIPSLARHSLIATISLDTSNPIDSFSFATSLFVLQMIPLHLMIWFFCCALQFVCTDLFRCSLCDALSHLCLRVESLVFFFICSFWCLCATIFHSAGMSCLSCYTHLCLSVVCPGMAHAEDHLE